MSRGRPLRVVFLTSARAWRGSGVSLAKIAGGLAERGHQPHMLADKAAVRDAFASLGLAAELVNAGDTGLREARDLRRLLQSLDPDAVVVDKPRDLRLAALATIGWRTAIIYRYNVNALDPLPGISAQIMFRRVRGCVYQSERFRQQALARAPWLGRARSWVIPNGYDATRFRPDPEAGRSFRAHHGIAPQAILVLTVAALERGKGHEVALAALHQLADSAELVYLMAGARSGYERELVSEAARSALSTRFLGFLETGELIDAFNGADLVLHPSLEDIFPNAVGEAMACGRPVIASDVGGVRELLGGDGAAGVLVPPGDPSALAGALAGLLVDPARRAGLGTAARRRIETQFSLDRMVDGYESALWASVGD
jgi:glycosyltransferase involved in cell wall biosynthesis